MIAKKKLGDMLLEEGIITLQQLQSAIEYQRQHNIRLGKAFLELGIISEQEQMDVLSRQLNIPLAKVSIHSLDEVLMEEIPYHFIQSSQFVPFKDGAGNTSIALVDPLDLETIDEIEFIIGTKPRYFLISESNFNSVVADYDRSRNAAQTPSPDAYVADYYSVEYTAEEESPVIKIINDLFYRAVDKGASDIHFNPDEHVLRIRFRIDGILYPIMEFPTAYHATLSSRIKLMAGMDITERRIPQDGKIKLSIKSKKIDVRVSSLPSIFGENITVRILNRDSLITSIAEIGFSPTMLNTYRNIMRKSSGIVLITGPTGSGKTSTLYTTIHEMNQVFKNIITIEDPVEYVLSGITQVQINPKAGLTFADGLRSILRQDPDIILIGEIRDLETAEIAIKASNTGHLVFATLHTNDSVSSISRLINMGIEPFLLSSSIIAVLSQRLARKICPRCQTTYKLSPHSVEATYFNLTEENDEMTFYKGEGCTYCNHSGYKGRTPIQELMVLDDTMKEMILRKPSTVELQELCRKNGMAFMDEDGLRKARLGITSLEEIMRVTG
ncbi:type IV pilus assembly protein PilB [Aneurinibacillus soli]|uniref:Type II secretion system protein E n=1 Tax=Aneurinibacillus soli TaxID=1500254 RepID=A0A0U5BB03_9BACL|nr:GspE/PulE family protein [Aneurinibacillus soli]PYE64127.1 type IV pilus assembly protein PilB [Aneurinibacillus soli]BAU28076.1 Type II secretion system protein E [Aneurinibacillus soli]